MQDMQDVWSVRFTCLLVCRSAIFIDSKRDGTGAAHGRKGFRMKNVRELETYGAILIGCGIMAYTLMLASVDAPVWATIEFVMGTLFMVVGVWCVYLAGMEYDYQMEKRRHRNKR